MDFLSLHLNNRKLQKSRFYAGRPQRHHNIRPPPDPHPVDPLPPPQVPRSRPQHPRPTTPLLPLLPPSPPAPTSTPHPIPDPNPTHPPKQPRQQLETTPLPHRPTHRLQTFSEGSRQHQQKSPVGTEQHPLPPASAAAENIGGGALAERVGFRDGKGKGAGAGVGVEDGGLPGGPHLPAQRKDTAGIGHKNNWEGS